MDALAVAEGNESLVSIGRGRGLALCTKPPLQLLRCHLYGRSPYTDPFLVTTLLSVQLPLFPRLRVDLTSQFSCDLVHQLLEGRLDLAIEIEPPESPLMTTVKIDEAPFYIAMSERDKLAACPSVNLDDMAGRCWVLFERRLHFTTRLCEKLRFGEFSQPESST